VRGSFILTSLAASQERRPRRPLVPLIAYFFPMDQNKKMLRAFLARNIFGSHP